MCIKSVKALGQNLWEMSHIEAIGYYLKRKGYWNFLITYSIITLRESLWMINGNIIREEENPDEGGKIL